MKNITMTETPFGRLDDGTPVALFTLENTKGMRVSISNFGGVITNIYVPDKHGNVADVVLGFDSIAPYQSQSPYFGALIGRYGNRIAKGIMPVQNKKILLDANDNGHHLHGGLYGFDKVVWRPFLETLNGEPALVLQYLSRDGDQGYPGNLQVEVTYQLTDSNVLFTRYKATTDMPTHVNLTQHSYFNLTGSSSSNSKILDHELTLFSKTITPVTTGLIPTGEFVDVEGTPFDFRVAKKIGQDIDRDDIQLELAGGYDHNFVLDKKQPEGFELAARVVEPISGRVLDVKTTEPGLQFYSGNFLDGTLQGKGKTFEHRSGLCLEPQHFPDTPNQPHFPSTLLLPGEEYNSTMSYEFSASESNSD